MDSHTEKTERIAKNTLMLYVRMLFSMLVSLYTSRIVLNTLGVEDYGIYNVVGGVVAMFSMISNSLSEAVGRFLTFSLGKGDTVRLKQIFSTSLFIHLLMGGVILILAESIGLWFLNTYLTIPDYRLYAANWVFQASIFSFLFCLLGVPFNASIIAHEHMRAFASIGILDITLRLLVVVFIAYIPFSVDKLIIYALLLLAICISIQCVYWGYCRKHFEECRNLVHFDKKSWKEMSAFAGWNIIGCTALLLKDQGVNILLNIFIGPLVNAARGIAVSVNAAVSSFVSNFMTALNPQITKSYAAGDDVYMFSLVERGARFSFYILLFFALPILLETDFILTLWLKQYPVHTVNFVRLVLLLSMCEVLSNTLIKLQLSTGKIRNYQLAVGGTLLLNFPLSYACLKLDFPPEATYIVALFISIACMALRLFFLRKMVQLPIRKFIKNVCLNVFIVSLISVSVSYMIHVQLPLSGWCHFVTTTVICIICCALSVYYIGCSKNERRFLVKTTYSALQKIKGFHLYTR